MSAIAIVGAGPRGTGILERLAASAPELLDDELIVHLVDPYPPGAGRIWRRDQSPLLAMNSMAADVTMYTDDSVVCEGPIVPGPSFWEWAQRERAQRERAQREQAQREQTEARSAVPDELRGELAAVTASTFPSRRLQSAYLAWVLADVLERLPLGMRVHLHRARAVRLVEDGATQVVHLSDGGVLRVDAVVLASGHLDATPTPDELALAAQAAAAGLRYLLPEQTTDSDLSVIAPGEVVLARGLGLAFVDLVVLLFEGRGGRFVDGEYVPSGREPLLVAGSPRGSTYHSKTQYQLKAVRPPLPRFFGPDVVDPLIASGRPVDLATQAWPLMAKEIAWGWYHELFRGHPERVRLDADAFAARFARLAWGSPDMAALIASAVPDPLDRLDLDALDRPVAGVHAPDLDALQPLLRAGIAEDLRQRVDDRHTPHLGAFVAMLSVYGESGRLAASLSARSRDRDLPWWQGFFNAVASGPPGFRVRQLLALSRAGFVRFLGEGMGVEVVDGAFRATSSAFPGTVTASVLVDARLPEPSVSRTRDPLVAGLLADGLASEETLVDADGTVLRNTGLLRVRREDGAVIDAAGWPDPHRYAVGPHTTVKVAGAFTRPGMNAQSLRYNDAVAVAVLRSLPVATRRRSAA